MTAYQPQRDGRFEYAGDAIEHIEQHNCTAEDEDDALAWATHNSRRFPGPVHRLRHRGHGAPARARILWSTDQLCMMDATDFEVLPRPNEKPQQPTVMAPFPGSAA